MKFTLLSLITSLISILPLTIVFAQELRLEKVMAAPDWLGRAPERPYWSDDSNQIYYSQKREGSSIRDLFRLDRDGENLTLISATEIASADVNGGDYSSNRRWKVYAREGDIYLKNLRNNSISQLTQTNSSESRPYFSSDDAKVIFRRDESWFIRHIDNGLESQAALLLNEKSPAQLLREDETNYLETQQSRLFEIVRLREEREQALREYREQSQRDDLSRPRLPFYLGENEEVVSSLLSPNEKWLAVVLQNTEEQKEGRAGSMPDFVTSSGYTENRELRARVGTVKYANQRLVLINLVQHRMTELDLYELPELDSYPIADQLQLDVESEETLFKAERNLRLRGLSWSDNGEALVFQALTRDHKDRWILSIDTNLITLETQEDSDFSVSISSDDESLSLIHHIHDPAWLFRDFYLIEWLSDNSTIVYSSEADGYLHFYSYSDGQVRQLTEGTFEVRDPIITQNDDYIYFRGNVDHPTIYDIFRVSIASAELEKMTNLGGMNIFRLSPDENHLLISHSEALRPTELYIQRSRPNSDATKITSTISDEFLAVNWSQPDFIEVRSSYSEDPIHSRVYTPDDESRNRPAVIFIHGAGYLQNAHQGWSGYFREFMFHSFLVEQGFVVLDMDYRASEGYGRDWRTAIYQRMGTPEVQDLANGIDWLVANKNVDRARVCAYGGSYGGFLTLMAMFQKPDLFACGAALRPVTDWATYNHGYTSEILNIPDLDPEAFERSSPIEFAEGLEKPLLIAHGMQDDNVFFQDSVRLVQRLIELEKENFEMAIYPIEPHGFREPSSWLDEYRRIYKIVSDTLQH